MHIVLPVGGHSSVLADPEGNLLSARECALEEAEEEEEEKREKLLLRGAKESRRADPTGRRRAEAV